MLLTASPEVPVMVAGTLYNTVTLGEQPLPLSLDQQYYSDEHRLVGLRRQVVMLDGQVITLTPRQYRLSALFVEHAREVAARATVFTQLWGYAPQGCAPLNARLWRLRKRLGATTKGPIMAEVHTTFRATARTTSSYGLLSGSGSIRGEVGLAARRNFGRMKC
jgi:hypothetical protein